MSESIKDKYKDLIFVLEFISKIPKDHKPCFKDKTTIDKKGWLVTFRRRWKKEKGEEGTKYLENILWDSCDIYYHMCLSERDLLISSLDKSVQGLDNLIETYKDQPNVSDGYKKCKEIILESLERIRKGVELFYIENNSGDNFF